MNTVGKILVILNLVFALVTGGFLAFDFATRTNWKIQNDELRKQLDIAYADIKVARGGTDVYEKREKAALAQLENAAGIIEKLKKDRKDKEDELAGQKATWELSLADLTAKHTAAKEEIDRLKTEFKDLNETIKKRNETILSMQDDLKKFQNAAVMNEDKFRSAQARNETLLNQVMTQQRKIAEFEAGPVTTASFKDPSQPNPPPVDVKGIVEKVDAKDKGLVQISLGTDQGVGVNHTLEVFRMNPPQYMGMIRIVETYPHRAIGRLVRNNMSVARGPIQEGDQVASRLGSR